MKVQDVEGLLKEVEEIKGLGGFNYSIAVADAIEKLERELTRTENIKKKSKDFEAFEKERDELLAKFSEKEEDGKTPKINWFMVGDKRQGSYVLDENRKEEREKEFEKLIEKHKKAIATQENKEKAYLEGRLTESKFKKVKIAELFIPRHLPTYTKDENGVIVYDEIQPKHIILMRKLLEIVKDEKSDSKQVKKA